MGGPGSLVRLLLVALLAGMPLAAFAETANVAPAAPDFRGIAHWINSPPLTMQQLRGKVVLVDFWAYSCINCLRTLPYITHWYNEYKDDGLVVVGVHTPEFDFEANTINVERAVKQFGIHYPVAQDNDGATWRAWRNQFWPAEYLIDRNGILVLHHDGEGGYVAMENAIRQLLGMTPVTNAVKRNAIDFARIGSPEMFFGSARLRNLVSYQKTSIASEHFNAPDTLALNRFALEGRWRIKPEYAELMSGKGEIRLHFKAGKLHLVASAGLPTTLSVTVDGKLQPSVIVQASRLYTLFDSHDYRDHVVVIKVSRQGLRVFSFTFG